MINNNEDLYCCVNKFQYLNHSRRDNLSIYIVMVGEVNVKFGFFFCVFLYLYKHSDIPFKRVTLLLNLCFFFSCCIQSCVTGQGYVNGRKKRDAGVETKSENGYIQKHISTSFRVTDNRMDTSASSGIYSRFSTSSLQLYPHIIYNERKCKIPVTSSTRNHETCK